MAFFLFCEITNHFPAMALQNTEVSEKKHTRKIKTVTLKILLKIAPVCNVGFLPRDALCA